MCLQLSNTDVFQECSYYILYTTNTVLWFQRLPPARGGTAQKKILHLANWIQLIHPGPASSLTKVFGVKSVMRVNAVSLLIRAATTTTSGTLNDLTTDLIMANNNRIRSISRRNILKMLNYRELIIGIYFLQIQFSHSCSIPEYIQPFMQHTRIQFSHSCSIPEYIAGILM